LFLVIFNLNATGEIALPPDANGGLGKFYFPFMIFMSSILILSVTYIICTLLACLSHGLVVTFFHMLGIGIPFFAIGTFFPNANATMRETVYFDIITLGIGIGMIAILMLDRKFINARYQRKYFAQTCFNVNKTAVEVWQMLCPIPEHKKTLFAPEITNVEMSDSESKTYSVSTTDKGYLLSGTYIFSEFEKDQCFTLEKTHKDRFGNIRKVIENCHLIASEGSTTVIISESQTSLPLGDWLWNKSSDLHGDYWDGFKAYCNGTRDYSVQGSGRKKRALGKSVSATT
jgi:hypothetical protein